jgi:two-component system, chemotaxis family, CheB/CheR fusion protein
MTDAAFEALLDFLKRSRGFDFSGYKRTSLERRFRRRMDVIACRTYGDYLDYLEVHPEEFEQLFDTLLINVTEFFRDPTAWDRLRGDVLPDLLAAKGDEEPIRVWSAGCASGEEAYTIAMILAELLGEDAYRERVKIYATDIDEDALTTGRHAVYATKQLESVPDELRAKYFERADKRMAFRKDLRRTVIFGRNNLVSDAPISRLDLLTCRNTLMYFTAETQARIVRHFHFALRDHGVLMLGKSEMMVSHRDVFAAIEGNGRIFRKLDRPASLQSRLGGLASGAEVVAVPLTADERASRDAALEAGPHPHIIVSRAGVLTFANLPARALFGIGLGQIGKPFQDVDLSYQPVDLRTPVEQAVRERRAISVGDIRFSPEKGDERVLDVTVVPLLPDDGPPYGVDILFEDVSRYDRMQQELEGNRRDLELAYEELQSTIDELETTNEELQSANEELQTTNEELQSTNEELETMNEELQSTNEELETINDELRDRTSELNNVNEFLEAILTSLGIGVAVVDRQQRVQVWNHRAEDVWGLRQDEAVDHHLLSLDIGLPTEQLAGPLRAVLGGGSEREQTVLDAVNRRGRSIDCATTILPLVSPQAGDGTAVRGAIILMEDGPTTNGSEGDRG